MRVLLDECVPKQLRRDLAEFEVRTVREMHWDGVKNGALIGLAAEQFDAVFTVDREFGENAIIPATLAVVILEAGTTDPALLRPHIPRVVAALKRARPGAIDRVSA